MPTYLTPGVYVEEVPSASKPIEGVGTSVAAFVGLAPAGPLNTPVQIPNWTEFVRTFGDPADAKRRPFLRGSYLAHAVHGYFDNGGTLAWIVRIGGAAHDARQAALPSTAGGDMPALQAVAQPGVEEPVKIELAEESEEEAKEPEGEGEDAQAPPPPNGGPTYRIEVSAGEEKETWRHLTVASGTYNILTRVNALSKLIRLEEVGAGLPEVRRTPAAGTYELTPAPQNGSAVKAEEIEGDPASRTGLGGLAAIDEITMVCVPDLMALGADGNGTIRRLQSAIIAHCEGLEDRMAILDPPPGLMPSEIADWRMDAEGGSGGYDSKFATLYYPWIEVADPFGDGSVMVPPCGHVAGVWARSDSTRGVHKAPANEVLRGVTGLGFQVTQSEQSTLNPKGINVIRSFPGRGVRIWGARTLSSDPEWRYINVRRLFNYVSESIMQGTQWAVFEPNDSRLWMSLRISTTNFLTRVWRDGALFGSSPGEAFYVKCDAETNPPDMVEAGQVTTEIGIAPVKPAEFVVFRISQYQVGAGE
jgi:Bacteriophage tail sheath protein